MDFTATYRPDLARPLLIARWAAKLTVVGLFTVVGWLPKLTGQSGALAERLPGGGTAVIAIALMELLTIGLILIPRTAVIGAGLAVGMMLGAIASHFGPVGFDGDFMGVFVAAIIALVAAAAAAWLEWDGRGRRLV
jgi:hypothetical protein